MEETTFTTDFEFFFIFSVFKENEVFNEEEIPSQKVVVADEEIDGIDIEDTGNLEDLPRIVLIDEECGNPKVVD